MRKGSTSMNIQRYLAVINEDNLTIVTQCTHRYSGVELLPPMSVCLSLVLCPKIITLKKN